MDLTLEKPLLRPSTPPPPEHGDPRVDVVKRNINALLTRLYPQEIPPKVKARFDKLDSSVVFSEMELIEAIFQDTPPALISYVAGIYHSESDRVLVLENAQDDIVTHECLHFISTDRDNQTIGLDDNKDKHITLGQQSNRHYLNEAMTELLTIAAMEHIDITNPVQVVGLSEKVRRKMSQKGAGAMAKSYQDALKTVTEFLTGFSTFDQTGKADYRYMGTFSDLARAYLEGDPIRFFRTMDEKLKQKGLLTKKASAVLEEKIAQMSETRADTVRTWFDKYAKEANTSSLWQRYKKYIDTFTRTMNGKNPQVEIFFQYPEYTSALMRLIPAQQLGKIETRPRLEVNLLWSDLFKDTKFHTQYLHFSQAAIYMAWQGMKIEAAAKGNPPEDKDFFENQTIQDIMTDCSSASYTEIELMAGKILGAKMNDKVREKILNEQFRRQILKPR